MHIYKRKIVSALCILVLAAGMTAVCLWNHGHRAAEGPEQFVLAGKTPVILKDGEVYRYQENGEWEHLALEKEVRLIVRGEMLCALYEDGSLFYDGDLNEEEVMPLGSARTFHMAKEELAVSRETPFVSINGNIIGDFYALLQNGGILYRSLKGHEIYQMDNETPAALSGYYILTEQGNVYSFMAEPDGYTDRINISMECVYDKGDITAIAGSRTALRGIGLTEDGRVERFYKFGVFYNEEISNWRNIISIEQGFSFSVGLTENGRVLFAGAEEESTNAVNKALQSWPGVIAIAADYDLIAGLKEDGSCVFLNLEEY